MAENTRNITCVACPLGCAMTVGFDAEGNISYVEGNTCKRGEAYARTECTAPTRMLTTTVKINGSHLPVVPVKSAKPLPKDKVLECAAALRDVTLTAPVAIGDVAVKDILGTGVDIVVTNEG